PLTLRIGTYISVEPFQYVAASNMVEPVFPHLVATDRPLFPDESIRFSKNPAHVPVGLVGFTVCVTLTCKYASGLVVAAAQAIPSFPDGVNVANGVPFP